MNAILNTNAITISQSGVKDLITRNRQGYAEAQDCLFLDYSAEHNETDNVHWNWQDWLWLRDILKAFEEEEFDWLWYGSHYGILCDYNRSFDDQIKRLNVGEKQIILPEVSMKNPLYFLDEYADTNPDSHFWFDNLQDAKFTMKKMNTGFHNIVHHNMMYIKKTLETKKMLKRLYNDARVNKFTLSDAAIEQQIQIRTPFDYGISCWPSFALTIYNEAYPEYANLMSGREMSSLSQWAIKPDNDSAEKIKQIDDTYESKSTGTYDALLAKGKTERLKSKSVDSYKFVAGDSFSCGQVPTMWISVEDYIDNIQAIITLNEEG